MNHIRRTLALAAAALALGAASPGTTLAADPPGKGITINIGYFPVVSPVPIMRSQRQLEDKGYTVNWVPINQGLPGAASAVAAGQLDIAWGNSISAVAIFSQSPDAAQFVGGYHVRPTSGPCGLASAGRTHQHSETPSLFRGM